MSLNNQLSHFFFGYSTQLLGVIFQYFLSGEYSSSKFCVPFTFVQMLTSHHIRRLNYIQFSYSGDLRHVCRKNTLHTSTLQWFTLYKRMNWSSDVIIYQRWKREREFLRHEMQHSIWVTVRKNDIRWFSPYRQHSGDKMCVYSAYLLVFVVFKWFSSRSEKHRFMW